MKTRLLGAAVLIALAVIFVPMFFSSNPTPPGGDKNVSLDIPTEPAANMQTRTMDLTAPPDSAAANGVAPATPIPAATAAVASPSTPAVAAAPQAAAPAPAPSAPVIARHGSHDLAQVEIPSRRPADVDTDPAAPAIPDRRRHPVPSAAAPVVSKPAVAAAANPPAPAPAVAVAAHGHYSLNLSAYASTASARNLISRVHALGYPAQAHALNQGGRTLALVTAGPFESRAAAEAARLKITQSVPGVPARLQSAASDQAGDAPVAAAAPAHAPAAAPVKRAGGWAVQLAAVGSQADANALRDRVKASGVDAYVDSVNVAGKRLWRVRAGPQAQRADAARLRETIRAKLGMAGNIVTAP